MADHTEFLLLARELIDEDGRLVTFQLLDGDAADPNKPWKGAGAPTVKASVDTYAVFLPSGGDDLGKIISNNELFKSCEQVLLVAPPVTGEDLGSFNVILDGGSRWAINVAQELKPGPTSLLFAIGVSR